MSPASARYLDVDLVLSHRARPTALLDALGPHTVVLRETRNRTVLELSRHHRSPLRCVAAWCALVESLRGPARRQWVACRRRVLDTGFDAPTHRPALEHVVPVSVLRRLVALELDLATTIYPRP